MKRILHAIWWFVLAVLAFSTAYAFYGGFCIAEDQEKLFAAIGRDIFDHPEKWESATIDGHDAIEWWKTLAAGHGATVLAANITHILLVAMVVHMALTFICLYRRKAKAQQTS